MAQAASRRRSAASSSTQTEEDREQDRIRAAAELDQVRVNRYAELENAYDGKHDVKLSARAKKYLQPGNIEFTENFIETVVDTLADRVKLVGFEVQASKKDGEKQVNEDAADWLNNTAWSASHGDQLQGIIHTKAPMLGDGYVIVEYDEASGLARAHYNRPDIIKPVYADDGTLLYVAKVWATSDTGPQNLAGRAITRLNLYYPERIEKWFTTSTGKGSIWAHWHDTDEEAKNDSWPVHWTDTAEAGGEPLGIPVFHFRFKALGGDFGRSKVKGALPFQYELNKQLLDIFEVRDQQGWPQRWATGVGDTSKRLRVAIGEILKLGATDAKFGQFEAADIMPLVEDLTATLTRMSAKTRTPMHDLIKGEPPSGESLKTAEGGLVKEAKTCHTDFGPTWASAGRMMLRLQTAFGDQDFDADVDVVPVWDDPETRNETDEIANAVFLVDLGVSNATVLRRLGFDPVEEKRLRAEEADEAPERDDTEPAAA